jgi:hypothetical protein
MGEAMGQLSAGSGEGQSIHRRGSECVCGSEREAVSNQTERLPGDIRYPARVNSRAHRLPSVGVSS